MRNHREVERVSQLRVTLPRQHRLPSCLQQPAKMLPLRDGRNGSVRIVPLSRCRKSLTCRTQSGNINVFGACPDLEVLELHSTFVEGKIMVFCRLKKLKRLTVGVQSLRGGKAPPAIEGLRGWRHY